MTVPMSDAPAGVQVDAGQLATLWQLSARARAATDATALGFTILNETVALLPYRQAAWWRSDAPGHVAAVSGLPQTDPNAPYVQWLGALCRALCKVPAGGVEHTGEGDGGERAEPSGRKPALRCFTAAELRADHPGVAEEWAAWWPAHGLWLPLLDRQGRATGGLLFARDQPWTMQEQAMLVELGRVWSHALMAFSPRPPMTVRLRQLLRAGRRRRLLLAALALLCLLPLRLTVLAPAEVTPKDPFIVRSPLDGVIDRLYVQPNQVVKPGTPLLSLDATTLRSHYEVARKDVDTAEEQYRQAAQLAVTDDRTRLEMTQRQGKLEQSRVELNYTAEQLARVNVNAPRAGVAIFSDPNEWTGKAVSVGEKILMLADPARVEVTAWLPVADNVDVRPGMRLTLYPKSSPLASYDGRIESVAWRAEPTPDGVLAYRVRASFESAGAQAPLGAMGTASVRGPWVPAIYYVLRRPLAFARQWLGW